MTDDQIRAVLQDRVEKLQRTRSTQFEAGFLDSLLTHRSNTDAFSTLAEPSRSLKLLETILHYTAGPHNAKRDECSADIEACESLKQELISCVEKHDLDEIQELLERLKAASEKVSRTRKHVAHKTVQCSDISQALRAVHPT
ncbi:MAG: hypothetical protein KDB23_18510 [Planctomycetales bacterium]|nr:hypothetical protein [Planctomycetales bacterium]